MVSLVILAIVLGCAALLYLKGTLAQGIMMILNSILASLVAFSFFEHVAALLTKYSPAIAGWSQAICFLLLFVLAFAVLQTIAVQLSKQKIDLGLWPERVGRVICGLVLGYIVVGHVLVAGAMAPLPNNYPYARFAARNPDPSKPNKALLNPDGFVVSLFDAISKGSFAALGTPKSFAMLHAGYLDELYLNRLKGAQAAPLRTSSSALNVPRQGGVWDAPNNLKDSDGKALPNRPGENLMLVRVGIRKSAIQDAGKFTLSQVRLICRVKGAESHPLAGKGQTVYPIGYIGADGQLERKSLSDEITIQARDIPDNAKNIDLAFYVPTDLTPTLIGFKLNNLERVSAPVSGEDTPQTVRFEGSSASPPSTATPPTPAEEPAPTSSSSSDRQRRGLSDISRSVVGGDLDEDMQP